MCKKHENVRSTTKTVKRIKKKKKLKIIEPGAFPDKHFAKIAGLVIFCYMTLYEFFN